MSVPFEHGGKNLFRAELEMKKNPERAGSTVKFLSFGHSDINCLVEEVICFIQQEDSSLNQRIQMNDELSLDEKILKILKCFQRSLHRSHCQRN